MKALSTGLKMQRTVPDLFVPNQCVKEDAEIAENMCQKPCKMIQGKPYSKAQEPNKQNIPKTP